MIFYDRRFLVPHLGTVNELIALDRTQADVLIGGQSRILHNVNCFYRSDRDALHNFDLKRIVASFLPNMEPILLKGD